MDCTALPGDQRLRAVHKLAAPGTGLSCSNIQPQKVHAVNVLTESIHATAQQASTVD